MLEGFRLNTQKTMNKNQQGRWYTKRLTELQRLKIIKRGLITRDKITYEYVKYITLDMTVKQISNRLRISVSAISADLKRFGIKKKRCRKHVKPTGCCVPRYQDRYSDQGNLEWRRLSEI